jgi:glutamate-5-semialdehyde dehydrogenase
MRTDELAVAGAVAAKAMLSISRQTKDAALVLMAARLHEKAADIFNANEADLEAAKKAGLPAPLVFRLGYGQKKLDESLAMLSALAALPDPSGVVLESRQLDRGLTLRRVSCPIGLIALIFESRPDALVQMSGLAAKSGNAIIVKGGREAERTNRVLSQVAAAAGEDAGLPVSWLGAIETRAEMAELLALDRFVDLVIPRGSNEFVRHIMDTSRVPVLGHADGVCHVYVHAEANLDMAARIVVDSKAQYPAACNAAEVLLVDAATAKTALPVLARALESAGVSLELCPRSLEILGAGHGRTARDEGDWSVEYLDMKMAVRIVDGIDDAIDHINQWGSGHTDAIVTDSVSASRRFMDGVDSASVFHNASTRFSDGYRYGLGAEVGISTGKIHARGPMGMHGLLTYKWMLEGSGQLVSEYSSGTRSFGHVDLDGEKGKRYDEV